MSYDTRLDGVLSLEPFPEGAAVEELRAELGKLEWNAGGRVVLTPLGHGAVVEGAVDWEVGAENITRAMNVVFGPRDIFLAGTLQAVGEDGAVVGAVKVSETGVYVESAEGGEGDDGEEESAGSWIEALGDEDAELREHAAERLGAFRGDEVLQALVSAARGDAEERVQRKALETLGEMGADAAGAVDGVAECLSDESPFVRYWATYALGRMGAAAAKALPALEVLTKEAADGPRYGAMDAIRRIKEAG